MKDIYFHNDNDNSYNYAIKFLGNCCARLFKYFGDRVFENNIEYTCTTPISQLENILGFPIQGLDAIPSDRYPEIKHAYTILGKRQIFN